ncbi:glycosyltransferase [bacterium]|nr:MAG: glycosyltransferase [bacterium]
MVTREFPNTILLAQSENLGFAGGNNLAFAKAKGNLIWLLNPDTEVLKGALPNLMQSLKGKPRAGGVASALIDARTGKVQQSCRTFPTPAALWTQALGLARAFSRSKKYGFYKMGWWNYRDEREVEQPMASSFLLRRVAIGTSGGLFDEEFPIFFNDVDLCWRLKLAGWEIWFTPHSRVKHWGGGATSQVRPAMIKESHASLRRFYEKWMRSQTSPLIYWATVAMFELAGLARLKLRGKN